MEFIPDPGQRFGEAIGISVALYHHRHIDDRLGCQPFNRSTADMLDLYSGIAKDCLEFFLLARV